MATYNYIGSDTTEDYWNEYGNRNDSYFVRSYGLADTILIGYGTMDIDAGDDNDRVQFLGTGIARLGNGNDSGTIGAQHGSSSIYGDAGDDSLFTFTGSAVGSLAAYGGTGNDYFTTSAGGTVLLDGGSGFDFISYAQNALLGKTLISIEGQTGSDKADIIDAWGTDDTLITSSLAPLFAELGITAFRNVLIGGGGADIVNGSGGSDFLDGSSVTDSGATLRAVANYRTGLSGLNADGFLTASDVESSIDTLTGNGGNDYLIGGYGGDSIDGGDGIDTVAYVERYHGDGGIAVDLVAGTASDGDTLTGIENVIGTRQADDTIFGNGQRNVIFGLGGNDALDGRTGIDLLDGGDGNDQLVDADGGDTLRGGDGDDSYSVRFASTRIIETPAGYYNGGRDTVFADLTWRLGNHIEDLVLVSKSDPNGNPLDGNYNGYGNALDNTLTGNRGNNVLDGGTGADTMQGLAGNDTYVVDNGRDQVIEAANGGTDTVRSSISVTLSANVENLVLTGLEAIDGTGNALNNVITGNRAVNRLDGGGGADRLDGGIGADTMTGGDGNDTFFVDDAGDSVIEASATAGGSDTVYVTAAAWTLGADQGVESLRASTGTGVTLTGNNLNQLIYGGAGADTLAGGGGTDRLYGGSGDDTYVVGNATTQAFENAGIGTGIDTVEAAVNFTLGANVENLVLTGAGSLRGTGNAEANTITGNDGANILFGGVGNDTLIGGLGRDQLTGGTEADTFVFLSSQDSLDAARDLIIGFSKAEGDLIDVSGIDADVNSEGDQAFSLVAGGRFTAGGIAGELIAVKSGSYTLIQGDTDGDAKADFGILLQGVIALQTTDFVL